MGRKIKSVQSKSVNSTTIGRELNALPYQLRIHRIWIFDRYILVFGRQSEKKTFSEKNFFENFEIENSV